MKKKNFPHRYHRGTKEALEREKHQSQNTPTEIKWFAQNDLNKLFGSMSISFSSKVLKNKEDESSQGSCELSVCKITWEGVWMLFFPWVKNLLMPFFLMGCFQWIFKRENGRLGRNRGNVPLRSGNGPLRPWCWLAFQSAASWAVFGRPRHGGKRPL